MSRFRGKHILQDYNMCVLLYSQLQSSSLQSNYALLTLYTTYTCNHMLCVLHSCTDPPSGRTVHWTHYYFLTTVWTTLFPVTPPLSPDRLCTAHTYYDKWWYYEMIWYYMKWNDIMMILEISVEAWRQISWNEQSSDD